MCVSDVVNGKVLYVTDDCVPSEDNSTSQPKFTIRELSVIMTTNEITAIQQTKDIMSFIRVDNLSICPRVNIRCFKKDTMILLMRDDNVFNMLNYSRLSKNTDKMTAIANSKKKLSESWNEIQRKLKYLKEKDDPFFDKLMKPEIWYDYIDNYYEVIKHSDKKVKVELLPKLFQKIRSILPQIIIYLNTLTIHSQINKNQASLIQLLDAWSITLNSTWNSTLNWLHRPYYSHQKSSKQWWKQIPN